MKNRTSILLTITTGLITMFIIMLILLASGYGEPGGLAKWLGLSNWFGSTSQETQQFGIPLTQLIAIVDILIALLAIAVTTRLTHKKETGLIQEIIQAEGTLEALTQGVIRLDENLRITYLNPAASRLLGEAPGELPETLQLIDGFTRQPTLDALLAECKENEVATIPSGTKLICRQGIELEVDGSSRVIRNDDGELQLVVLLLRDITEEREWTRRQPDLWDRDTLTTLPGRSFMTSRLARVLERVRAGERPIAYIHITLEGIRKVYQKAGTKAGNALVRHLTGLLRPHVRDTDLLARMDLEEFGALLTLCPQEVAGRIATDILASLSSSHFNWEGKTYQIKARLGRVQIPPFEGTVEELLDAASHHD